MKSRQGSSMSTNYWVTSGKAGRSKMKSMQGSSMSTTYRVTSGKAGRSKMNSRQGSPMSTTYRVTSSKAGRSKKKSSLTPQNQQLLARGTDKYIISFKLHINLQGLIPD